MCVWPAGQYTLPHKKKFSFTQAIFFGGGSHATANVLNMSIKSKRIL